MKRLIALVLGLALLAFLVRPSAPQAPTEIVSPGPPAPSQHLLASRPGGPSTPDVGPAPAAPAENLLQRALKGSAGTNHVDMPRLTTQQLEPYLAQSHRSAASLLAAFRASGEPEFLHEAMRNHPGDPGVALAAIFEPAAPPDQRQRWVEAFEQAAPDNALANYLGALEAFKSGQPAEAARELQAAAAKPSLQDYSADLVQNAHEAYQAAGYSDADAATAAAIGLPLPYLPDLKALSRNIGDIAAQYRQAGDPASAQAVLQMGLDLGQRLNTGTGTMIQEIVGLTIQKNLLASLDPAAPYGAPGETVQNQIDTLNRQRTALQTLASQQPAAVLSMPDADVVNFFQRMKTSGETAAIRWAISKYPGQ